VDIGQNCCVPKGGITLSTNFCPPTTVGVKKLESLGYHVALFVWSYV